MIQLLAEDHRETGWRYRFQDEVSNQLYRKLILVDDIVKEMSENVEEPQRTEDLATIKEIASTVAGEAACSSSDFDSDAAFLRLKDALCKEAMTLYLAQRLFNHSQTMGPHESTNVLRFQTQTEALEYVRGNIQVG